MRTSLPVVSSALEAPAPARVRQSPLPVPLVTIYRWLRAHMTDEWAVALLATILSIGFFAWYESHGLTIAFNDARSRELIARRVLMSRTPGLAQFGTTWPPLPAVLMQPLIWNDALFRDGIAGSFPSMLAYVVAVVYMYRIARLVTSSRGGGWVAAGTLMLNPSLLYMQSTPMSEAASLSALVVTIYYALQATRSYHALDVVKCAAAAAAGTLIRYENWMLAIAVIPILAYVALRRKGYLLAEAWTILYGLLAFAGCAAWIAYNWVIFHDPLVSFFYGQQSHKYYANTPDYLLPARHHAEVALTTYGLTVADTVGWAIVALGLLGLIAFVWHARQRLPILSACLALIPFGFYWLVLYTGVNTETLPQLGTGPYYNIRFGLLMVPAVALFAAFLAMTGPRRVRRVVVCAALAVVVSFGIAGSTMQTPFVLREATAGYGGDTRQTSQDQARWFSSHYRGGNILYSYSSDSSLMFYLLTKYHFADKSFITDANGAQFDEALAHPAHWVTWIVMNPGSGGNESRVWSVLQNRRDWRRYFVLRKTFLAHHSAIGGYGKVQLYERRSPGD